MAEETKITLSAKELELVINTEWIFTKHKVIQKVINLFGEVVSQLEKLAEEQQQLLPADIFGKRPKISKGENYQLLPYVMLDYPRCFEKENTLAIRTFFWWGNFFSISLQLSGKYQADFKNNIEQRFEWLQQKDFWVCINNTPWEHDFTTSNYVQLKAIDKEKFSAIVNSESFVKLAKKISLQLWQTVPEFIVNSFEEMLQLLQNG